MTKHPKTPKRMCRRRIQHGCVGGFGSGAPRHLPFAKASCSAVEAPLSPNFRNPAFACGGLSRITEPEPEPYPRPLRKRPASNQRFSDVIFTRKMVPHKYRLPVHFELRAHCLMSPDDFLDLFEIRRWQVARYGILDRACRVPDLQRPLAVVRL